MDVIYSRYQLICSKFVIEARSEAKNNEVTFEIFDLLTKKIKSNTFQKAERNVLIMIPTTCYEVFLICRTTWLCHFAHSKKGF